MSLANDLMELKQGHLVSMLPQSAFSYEYQSEKDPNLKVQFYGAVVNTNHEVGNPSSNKDYNSLILSVRWPKSSLDAFKDHSEFKQLYVEDIPDQLNYCNARFYTEKDLSGEKILPFATDFCMLQKLDQKVEKATMTEKSFQVITPQDDDIPKPVQTKKNDENELLLLKQALEILKKYNEKPDKVKELDGIIKLDGKASEKLGLLQSGIKEALEKGQEANFSDFLNDGIN